VALSLLNAHDLEAAEVEATIPELAIYLSLDEMQGLIVDSRSSELRSAGVVSTRDRMSVRLRQNNCVTEKEKRRRERELLADVFPPEFPK
jgi:hypothetical protein